MVQAALFTDVLPAMDCSATCIDADSYCRPNVCRRARPTDPLREEAVFGKHDSPRQPDPRHDSLLNDSPGGWVSPIRNEEILSGRIDDLARFGVTTGGVVALKQLSLEKQEDLLVVEESTLQQLALAPSDLTIVLAIREEVRKRRGPLTGASSRYAVVPKAEAAAQQEIASRSNNQDRWNDARGPTSPPVPELGQANRLSEKKEPVVIADVLRGLSDEPGRIPGESPGASS